jgi:hypothetical protein
VAPFYLNFLAETRVDQRADGNLSDGGSVWDDALGQSDLAERGHHPAGLGLSVLRRPPLRRAELRDGQEVDALSTATQPGPGLHFQG